MVQRPQVRASRNRGEPVVGQRLEERPIWQPSYKTPNAFLVEPIRQHVGKSRARLPFGPAECWNAMREVDGKTGTTDICEDVIIPVWGRGCGNRYFFRLRLPRRQKLAYPPQCFDHFRLRI